MPDDDYTADPDALESDRILGLLAEEPGRRKEKAGTHPEPVLRPCRVCGALVCHGQTFEGKRVAVAARDGWSWIPDPEDDMPPHPDVVACGYCHLRCLRDGALTLSESREQRRFRPDVVDAQRRSN